jgi:hypothetical protein
MSFGAIGQTELEERGVEQYAGMIAGKGATAAIRAVFAGRQPNDEQPGLGVAEGRHGLAIVRGMLGLDRVEKCGKTGAAPAPGIKNVTHEAVGCTIKNGPRRINLRGPLSSAPGIWTNPSATQTVPLIGDKTIDPRRK